MSDSQAKTPPLSAGVSAVGQTLATQHGSNPLQQEAAETRVPSGQQTLSTYGAPGQMIGGYAIEEEVGRGGMGVVYRARQPGLNRIVALKMILHADHAGVEDRLRFLREAESLARLKHENIVQVYEVGEHDGKPFFSLEYVEGGSLDRQLKGTPLPPREAAALVEKLAAGVQSAHDAGIIHRDLKPANVLIVDRGSSIVDRETLTAPSSRSTIHDPRSTMIPKITDFGLAKKQDEAGMSASGAVLGTPSYMAPEQAAGKLGAIDARTDVYALGAILYECLTGRPPFRAATAMDTMRQVLNDEPVSVRSLSPMTPQDLETICLKCLQKEPERRYATARELADDLGRYLRGEPVQARPVGQLQRGWRWCRRNRVVAGLLAGIGVLLLLVALVSTVLGRVAWQKAVEAEARAEDAAREEQRAKTAEEGQKQKAEEAASESKRAKLAEEGQRKKAEDEAKQRRRAEDEEARTRRMLYAGQLSLAQSYWQEGRVGAAREKLDEIQEHRDTWEHRYLCTMMYHRGQRTFPGHTDEATCVSFSPDGRRIASGSKDRTVRMWDARTGQTTLILPHAAAVTCLSFSPDGRRIATGTEDQKVHLWDARIGLPLFSIKGHKVPVTGVSFSPDGTRLATCGGALHGPGELTVRDAQTGRELLPFNGHTLGVYSVSFSPDGKRIVSGSQDQSVRVWDAQTGQNLRTLSNTFEAVLSVSYSPDGKRIASCDRNMLVKVWDAQTGQQLLTLKGHTFWVQSVCFSPDARRVASAGKDGQVKVWDARTGQDLFTLRGHAGGIAGVSFSPDGRSLVSAGDDQTVKMWDAQTGQDLLTLRGHSLAVTSVCFSPDGTRLVSGSYGTLRVWDAQTGQTLFGVSEKLVGFISSVSYSPDGKRFATGSFDSTVRVWDARTGQLLLTLKGHKDPVNSVDFSSDGKQIVSAGMDGEAKVWDAQTGQILRSFKAHPGNAFVSFSPDGKRLATAGQDAVLKVWDAKTHQLMHTLQGHGSGIHCVTFSRDGLRLASASLDGTVRVWDADSGENQLTLKGHSSMVVSVSFSPDGKRLASGSYDNTVKVWDAQTGQELITFKEHAGAVRGVRFSPDGRSLASAGQDGTVKVRAVLAGQDHLTLKGHTGQVHSLVFRADGKRLASGSDDETVRLWDAQTGKNLHTLRGHAPGGTCVNFSPDGKRLAAGTWQRVHVWDADTGKQQLVLGGHADRVTGVLFSFDSKLLLSRDVKGEQRMWNLATGKPIPGGGGVVILNSSPRSLDGRLVALAEGSTVRVYRAATFQEAEQPGYRWWADPDTSRHAAAAGQMWQAGDWFLASFHLGRLLHEQPWDADLHVRRAYALTRLDRPAEAASDFLQAVLLNPRVHPWPLDPEAAGRGHGAAQTGDWARAVVELELAAHQRTGSIHDWKNLVLARAAAGQPDAVRQSYLALFDQFENDAAAATALVSAAVTVPCTEAAARRLVAAAERLVAARRDPSTLSWLGAALYRAGRFAEAAESLQKSIRLIGGGGFVDTSLFLAMVQQRLGRGEEARTLLGRFEAWHRGVQFPTWQERTQWKLLLDEARAAILTMPRASD